MKASARRGIGVALYICALLLALGCCVYLVWAHWSLWMSGNMVLGPFSLMFVLEFLVPSALLWGAARHLGRIRTFDLVLVVLVIAPFGLLVFIPSKFVAG
jgi:hypothetical protein